MSLFFDLREQPGLEQGATMKRDGQCGPAACWLRSLSTQKPQVSLLQLHSARRPHPPRSPRCPYCSCSSPGDHDPRHTCLHGTVGVLK